jgi:hypothetical protein
MRLLLVSVMCVAAACGGRDESPAPSARPVADSVGAEPSSWVVLAGNWTVREEAGERMVRVDGTSWKTGTPPVDLQAKAARLFPSSAATFAERVQAGLLFPYVVDPSVDTFSDGEIQVDFRLVGGASDQFASILFGLTADGDHYAYRYNTKDGDTALWKVVNGQRERIHHGGVHIEVPLNEWRTLKMRVRGPEITGWVNDTQALQFTLPAPVAGKVGLWSKADSVTDYKNYRVTR